MRQTSSAQYDTPHASKTANLLITMLSRHSCTPALACLTSPSLIVPILVARPVILPAQFEQIYLYGYLEPSIHTTPDSCWSYNIPEYTTAVYTHFVAFVYLLVIRFFGILLSICTPSPSTRPPPNATHCPELLVWAPPLTRAVGEGWGSGGVGLLQMGFASATCITGDGLSMNFE